MIAITEKKTLFFLKETEVDVSQCISGNIMSLIAHVAILNLIYRSALSLLAVLPMHVVQIEKLRQLWTL